MVMMDKTLKRRGAVGWMQYRDDGYFYPEALINYLVRLGWGTMVTKRSLHVKKWINSFQN